MLRDELLHATQRWYWSLVAFAFLVYSCRNHQLPVRLYKMVMVGEIHQEVRWILSWELSIDRLTVMSPSLLPLSLPL